MKMIKVKFSYSPQQGIGALPSEAIFPMDAIHHLVDKGNGTYDVSFKEGYIKLNQNVKVTSSTTTIKNLDVL